MLVFDLIKAVGVRIVLLVHSLLVIWLAASVTRQRLNWILALANIGLLAESFVTLVKNKGQEWKWFCPCFFFYLCSTIPGIWILELDRMRGYQGKVNAENTIDIAVNTTERSQLFDDIQGVTIPVFVETKTLVMIMEQMFLYLMILSRWILPRGEITRNELSQLLFVFIGIASDITELFALFEETAVRMSTNLTYVILCIWSISLLQFTFVLTSTHSPKKPRTALATEPTPADDNDDDANVNVITAFFQTEVWSICINFLLQDGPFLAVRLYTMIEFKVLTYSIIFFTAKNGLLVMLLVYRLSVLCLERKSKGGTAEEETSSVGSKKALSDPNAKSVDFIEKIDESNKGNPAVSISEARKRNGNNAVQNEP